MPRTALKKVNDDPVSKGWFEESVARGAKEPFAEIMDITPELARVMLKNNEGNRGVYSSNLRTIALDLENDRWQFNGESIVVNSAGGLNDGQHRLQAVVETGIPIRAVVVFGPAPESRLTLDLGRHRDAADNLHFRGIKNAHTVAAITRLVLAWERADGRNLNETKHVSIPEQVTRALADEALYTSAHVGSYSYTYARPMLTGSQIGFCHYILTRIDPEAADRYIEQVTIGEGLKRTDPAFVVRKRLAALEGRSREPRIAMILRGWNFYRGGESPLPQQITGESPFPDLAS